MGLYQVKGQKRSKTPAINWVGIMSKKGLLNELEVAALYALYTMSGGASTAHFSAEAVASKFRSDSRGGVREGLAGLERNPHGYAFVKPTAGGLTYGITPNGVRKLRELKLI
jgi:hypothetical protein